MYLLRVELKTILNIFGVEKVAYDLFPSHEEARKAETLIWIRIPKVKATKIAKVTEYTLRTKKLTHTWAA